MVECELGTADGHFQEVEAAGRRGDLKSFGEAIGKAHAHTQQALNLIRSATKRGFENANDAATISKDVETPQFIDDAEVLYDQRTETTRWVLWRHRTSRKLNLAIVQGNQVVSVNVGNLLFLCAQILPDFCPPAGQRQEEI